MILCLFLITTSLLPSTTTVEYKVEDRTEVSPAVQSEEQVLRFKKYGASSYLDELFLEQHPGVRFEYVDADDYTGVYYPDTNPVEEYNINDPTAPIIDIYILSDDEGLHRLKQEGYLLDLSSSDSISAAHETYFPQAKEVLSVNGKPVAVPISFEVGCWDYNKKEWDALGLPSVPRTADELVQLISRWNQDLFLPPGIVLYGNGGWFDIKIELLTDVINMYLIENASDSVALNFDTPEFRDMVTQIMDLPALPYCQTMCTPLLFCNDRVYPYLCTLQDLTHSVEMQGWWTNGEVIEMVPILPIGFSRKSTAMVGAEMEVVCVAANTQNRELAMEYIEFVFEHQTYFQEDLSAMLTLNAQAMDALGIPKETQNFYCDLVPNIAFGIGAFGGFQETGYDSESFWAMYLVAYNLANTGDPAEIDTENLLIRMKENISPLIEQLNKDAQYYFTNRY